jgi:purine-binding chemotaxis protein CheW
MTPTFEPANPTADGAGALSLLIVQLDRERYALPSAAVREIARYRPCTPVPGAPAALPGIISQRGAILPVVDLRPVLGLPDRPLTKAARLVIGHHAGVDMALIAEAVEDLVTLPADAFERPPAGLDPARAALLRGIAADEAGPVALIDLDALIAALRGA